MNLFRKYLMMALSIMPLCFSGAWAAPMQTGYSQDIIKVFLMLAVVVVIIFCSAWLIRRISGGLGVNQKHIRVLSVMPLSTREKIMLIEAASEYLLIGVTPNGIQTLHRFDEPIDESDSQLPSPFADRLKSILKGLDSDPLAKHRKSSDT